MHPKVIRPTKDFPYHGIALANIAAEYKMLTSLESAERSLVDALQQQSRSKGLSNQLSPQIDVQDLPMVTGDYHALGDASTQK